MGSKFKIGDRVKIVKFPNKRCIGYICEVIDDKITGTNFCCKVVAISNPEWRCVMKSDEIELCLKRGEQLLLFKL